MLIGRLAFDGHFEIDFGGCTLLRAVNSVSIGRQSIGLPPAAFWGRKDLADRQRPLCSDSEINWRYGVIVLVPWSSSSSDAFE
jgi:hypothetical protein